MAGPGVTVEPAAMPGGVQIAQEQIWEPDMHGTLRLSYGVGQRIPAAEVARLNVTDGRVRLVDKADVAPMEKARRRAQDKARRPVTVEDKAVTVEEA